MLVVSQSSLDQLEAQKLADFVKRCASFVRARGLASSHYPRGDLEDWIERNLPIVRSRGFLSEQAIVLILSLNIAYRRDVLDDPSLRTALSEAAPDEETRLGAIMRVVQSGFGAPHLGAYR